jgi:hypothetical protein
LVCFQQIVLDGIEVRNPGPGLGQAQQYGRVKLVNEIPTLVRYIYSLACIRFFFG